VVIKKNKNKEKGTPNERFYSEKGKKESLA